MSDANGVQRSIGEIIGEDKSIVVFLRHLGELSIDGKEIEC
jgi:hypothetical protein